MLGIPVSGAGTIIAICRPQPELLTPLAQSLVFGYPTLCGGRLVADPGIEAHPALHSGVGAEQGLSAATCHSRVSLLLCRRAAPPTGTSLRVILVAR